jgi:hypothetical protein
MIHHREKCEPTALIAIGSPTKGGVRFKAIATRIIE